MPGLIGTEPGVSLNDTPGMIPTMPIVHMA